MTDTVRASGEAMPAINRRNFLRTSVAASAAIAVATPVVAAEPEMTPHEKAVWHMRELERLAIEAGAAKVTMIVIAYQGLAIPPDIKSMMIDFQGNLRDDDDMFAPKGGAA